MRVLTFQYPGQPDLDKLSDVPEMSQRSYVVVTVTNNRSNHASGTPEANQGGKTASDIGRQIRQAAVMLKSAAALTSTFLR